MESKREAAAEVQVRVGLDSAICFSDSFVAFFVFKSETVGTVVVSHRYNPSTKEQKEVPACLNACRVGGLIF
jgi:hypothetical protein